MAYRKVDEASLAAVADAIREQAMKEGMRTIRMSAAEYVLDGTTSYSEAARISFEE